MAVIFCVPQTVHTPVFSSKKEEIGLHWATSAITDPDVR